MTFDSKLDPFQSLASTSPTLQIWLLGGWRILSEGASLTCRRAQPCSLCAYLLLQPGGQATRSAIIEHLWPDAAPDRARRYLTDARSTACAVCSHRKRISADAEQVTLHLDAAGWVDVWAFDRALASADPARAVTWTGALRRRAAPGIHRRVAHPAPAAPARTVCPKCTGRSRCR